MVPLANLLAFSLASVVLIAVPGPSVLFVIGRSLALGWKGGVLPQAESARPHQGPDTFHEN
jgi:threonine/homoserine/homoserine lactone efflux protein